MKVKEYFYSIYKEENGDLRPLAFFKNRQEVEKFLNVKKSFVFENIKKSKDWESNVNSTQKYFIFKDVIKN